MASITLVIDDLPKGRGFTVRTDACAIPTVGQQLTPAEAFAGALLRRARLESEHLALDAFAASPTTPDHMPAVAGQE